MPNGIPGPGEAPSAREMARLERAKEVAAARLFAIPGVHTVGIGYKQRGGEVTGELAVVVFVDKKLPRADVDPDWMVPPEIRFFMESADQQEVVPTDVIERARAVEYPHIPKGTLATWARPAGGGRSISLAGSGGGTLGGWVWDDLNDQIVLLSNHHVLGSTAGADVFQPWGSTAAADHLADVVRTGTLDATIAAPVNLDDVLLEIEGVGPAVYEAARATVNMPVEKSGAKTDHTYGRVMYVGLAYDSGGHYGSRNDFEVWPTDSAGTIDPYGQFAYFGDSGSLIVERTNPSGASWKRAVGLLWGGHPQSGDAHAHQIEDVFANLKLSTLCGPLLEAFLDSLFAPSFAGVPPSVTPIQLPEPRRPLHRGMARDIEKRLQTTRAGSELVAAVHEHRVGVVRLAFDRETRRALAAAAAPFAESIWTPDELLRRRVTEEDLSRFRRVMRLAEDRRPELGPLLERLNSILEALPGRSLADVMQ